MIEGTAVLAFHAIASAHAFALLPLGLGRWMLLAPFTSQLPLLLWLSVRCGPMFASAGSLVLGLSILGSFTLERGRADGRVQWLSWEVRPWHDAGGAVGGIFIVSRDITAKVKAEPALSESREDLNRAQAVAQTGSWRLNVRTNELS